MYKTMVSKSIQVNCECLNGMSSGGVNQSIFTTI